MKNKINLIVVYALLAMTCNMSAMEEQENNNLTISHLPENPSNSPCMRRCPSREDLSKALLTLSKSSESLPISPVDSPKRTRSSSPVKNKAEISPVHSPSVSPQNSSRTSRSSSPVRNNEEAKPMITGYFTNWAEDHIPLLGISAKYDQNEDQFFVMYNVNGEVREIMLKVLEKHNNRKYVVVLEKDNNHSIELINNTPQNLPETEPKETTQQINLQDQTEDTKFEKTQDVVKDLKEGKTAQEYIDDLKNSKKPFLKLKDPRQFALGMSVLVIFIGWYMYKCNKLPDFMINFINKILPSSYSR